MRKAAVVLVFAAVACSTVHTLAAAPPADCQNLGTVTSQADRTIGGKNITNDNLIEYAMKDARNKAAELGATDIQFQAPHLGPGYGTRTTATVIAVAYKCKSP